MAENAADVVGAEVSVEIAGRLRALSWSASELSRRSGVSREVISGLLNGRRLPSLSTYERLRRTLGLLPSPALLTRPAPPVDVSDEHLSRLAACVVVGRSVLLADLSDATGWPSLRCGRASPRSRSASIRWGCAWSRTATR